MSRNVYEAMGHPDPETMEAKAELTARIYVEIDRRGLTRPEAARLLGLSKSKLAVLLRGDFENFSVPALVDFLNRLGHDVEFIVKSPGADADGPGRTTITAA